MMTLTYIIPDTNVIVNFCMYKACVTINVRPTVFILNQMIYLTYLNNSKKMW